jgi:Ca2+-binding RTX toxin-like protein
MTDQDLKYSELLAKYNADKDAYENYTRDYQNRLQNTPMYLQSQFDTSAQPQTYTPATTIEGLYNQYLKRAPDAEGLAFWKKGFGDSVDNLERSSFLQAATPEISRNNLGSRELYDLTKSYWGGQLGAPTYGTYKPPVIDTVVGGGGNDKVVGGGGNDTVISTVVGGGGNDTIVGGGGNDLTTVVGGTGNDTLVGGTGNDTVVGGTGNDTLVGGDGNDITTVVGGTGNDTIVGGTGNDTVVGGTGNDTITGGDGNDLTTVVGGTGNDTLDGGDGNDLTTIIGGLGNDTLIGGGTNDTLVGGGTNDTLVGGGTNDTITGGGNNDSILTTLSTITGGAGNDTVVGGNNNDSVLTNLSTVTGGAGNDLVTDDGTTGGVLSTIANLNNTTGSNTTTSVTGGAGNDSVIGALSTDDINRLNDTYLNTVTGGAGNDVIADDGTTDSILSAITNLNNTAADTTTSAAGSVTGGAGSDNVIGTLSTDDINRLNDTYLNNTVTGGAGNDSISDYVDTQLTADQIAASIARENNQNSTVQNQDGNLTSVGTGSDFTAATDLGNGLFAVENGDGTQSIFTDDGTPMGSTGGGLESVQDWEGNKTLTGIPNVSVQGGNDTIGNVNDLFYYPEGADQVEKYNSWLESMGGSGVADDFGKYSLGVSDFGGGYGGGGGGKYMDMYDVSAYAKGGPVKTHYQTAGRVQLPSGYESPEDEADWMSRWESQRVPVETNAINMAEPPKPVMNEPKAPLAAIAMNEAPVAPAVVAAPKPPPVAPPAFGAERMGNIQALLAAYGPKDGAYGEDLKTARTSAKAESDAFAKMLSDAMKSPEDEKSSKAEMYFRLASAFGAPTKTGHFTENLSLVGKELGEYAKNKRASSQQKLALALEGQKMKMTAAKEDLNTLRSLAGEEMKDKRAIATELIKDYIKSGEPQSTAGKQALDEGYKTGTPEYQKRVAEIGNLNVEAKMAQITASLANIGTAQANLALSQEKFQNQKAQQAKLTGPEVKLKTETEETLAQTEQALTNLRKAYALNPNTFDTSLIDVTQRKLLEAGGSKDPKVAATREMENLLEKSALDQLKATFPGAISNDERKALQDVQGLGAKSKEERARIMKNGYAALKSVSERHRKRLNEINSGVYRDAVTTIDGGTD